MSKRYLIFDVDQTLLDTRHLAELRRAGKWKEISSQRESVTPFKGVPELLKKCADIGYKIGFLTNSPAAYCNELCQQSDLTAETIVSYHDVTYPKPNPEGVKLVIARLAGYTGSPDKAAINKFIKEKNANWSAVVVGDSWEDMLAASSSYVDSIAALWSSSDGEETVSAEPFYITDKVPELEKLLVELRRAGKVLTKEKDAAHRRYRDSLWKRRDNNDGMRSNLRRNAEFLFARNRWQGSWHTSCGNSLVNSLKAKIGAHEGTKWIKDAAAKRFARELAFCLPQNATMMFIASSKLPNHPGFDDRFDRVGHHLNAIRRDVRIVDSIQVRESQQAAHESDDANLRDPAHIKSNLIWSRDLPRYSETVFIIDDVLTSGGHFEAYLRMLDEHAPGTRGIGVFWALHHSQPRY